MPDHVHMLISNIYSATQIIGYLKGSINSGRASVLCHDHWPGRGIDPGLHPKPRTGRSAVGAVRAEDFSSPKFNQSSKHPLKPPLAVPNQTSSFAGGYWLLQTLNHDPRGRLSTPRRCQLFELSYKQGIASFGGIVRHISSSAW